MPSQYLRKNQIEPGLCYVAAMISRHLLLARFGLSLINEIFDYNDLFPYFIVWLLLWLNSMLAGGYQFDCLKPRIAKNQK